mmetsp:Transcript_32160/g.125533  ORF Transcript_32160/g.125533 Transcript_32160/m.125533 type:complete len:89 (-) Transcript_32160:2748-3014(-)
MYTRYADMPRPSIRPRADRSSRVGLTTLYGYYNSEKCSLCAESFQAGGVCGKCNSNPQSARFVLSQRLKKAEVSIPVGNLEEKVTPDK